MTLLAHLENVVATLEQRVLQQQQEIQILQQQLEEKQTEQHNLEDK